MRTRALAAACAAALTLVFPAGAQPRHGIRLPEYIDRTLANGARLLLMEKRDVPIVAFTAVLRGGATTDPPGRDGLSSLTAALLEKGAGGRSALQFAEAVEGAGGRVSAGTQRESLVMQGQFLARDIDLCLELLADMLRRPAFAAAEVEKTRTRLIHELAAARDSDPRRLIGSYFHAFHFGLHPYGRPIGGTEATLAKLTGDDVAGYYRTNFAPERLILAFAGDFAATSLGAKIETAFGDWTTAGAPLPNIPAPLPSQGRRVLLVDKPDATQTYFWIGNAGIARNDPDRVAVDLANTAFGGRFTSLLNTELRIKSGLSYGASSQLTRERVGGALAIASYTKTESTEKAVELALELLTTFRRNGVDAPTLDSVKNYVLGQFPPELETSGALAERLAEIALYGLDRRDVDDYAPTVQQAARDAVNRTITRVYPEPANLTFVFIGRASRIRSAVEKYGPVSEISITASSFAPPRQE